LLQSSFIASRSIFFFKSHLQLDRFNSRSDTFCFEFKQIVFSPACLSPGFYGKNAITRQTERSGERFDGQTDRQIFKVAHVNTDDINCFGGPGLGSVLDKCKKGNERAKVDYFV
jgi:hypothetical protein